MQWWANFLSVVGQLVGRGGPTWPTSIYVKICLAIDTYMHVCVHIMPTGKKATTQ